MKIYQIGKRVVVEDDKKIKDITKLRPSIKTSIDLIKVAFKDALSKVESTSSQKMGGLVPSGMNLPF